MCLGDAVWLARHRMNLCVGWAAPNKLKELKQVLKSKREVVVVVVVVVCVCV